MMIDVLSLGSTQDERTMQARPLHRVTAEDGHASKERRKHVCKHEALASIPTSPTSVHQLDLSDNHSQASHFCRKQPSKTLLPRRPAPIMRFTDVDFETDRLHSLSGKDGFSRGDDDADCGDDELLGLHFLDEADCSTDQVIHFEGHRIT
jgi:hypothetical protein